MIAQLIGGHLPESAPRRSRGAGSAAVASTVVHVALVGLAVSITGMPRLVRERMAERVATVRLPTISPERAPERVRSTPRTAGFQVLAPPKLDVSPSIPPIDLTRPATHEEDFTGKLVAGGVAGPSAPRLTFARNDPIDGTLADESPYLLPGQMGPSYPEALRDDRPDGVVVVRFVIDTLGRVEVPSFKVVAATNPLFEASVRSAIDRLRYMPASQDGHPVRVKLEQRFEFHLAAP